MPVPVARRDVLRQVARNRQAACQQDGERQPLRGQRQQRLAVADRKCGRAGETAEQQAVGRHAAEPERGNQPRVLAVERPFVERDLDGPPAREDADADAEARAPDFPARQVQPPPVAAREEVQLQQAQRKAQPVPSEMDPAGVEQDGIDAVDVGSEHAPSGRLR